MGISSDIQLVEHMASQRLSKLEDILDVARSVVPTSEDCPLLKAIQYFDSSLAEEEEASELEQICSNMRKG